MSRIRKIGEYLKGLLKRRLPEQRMSWQEAEEEVEKCWEKTKDFDFRGMQLGLILTIFSIPILFWRYYYLYSELVIEDNSLISIILYCLLIFLVLLFKPYFQIVLTIAISFNKYFAMLAAYLIPMVVAFVFFFVFFDFGVNLFFLVLIAIQLGLSFTFVFIGFAELENEFDILLVTAISLSGYFICFSAIGFSVYDFFNWGLIISESESFIIFIFVAIFVAIYGVANFIFEEFGKASRANNFAKKNAKPILSDSFENQKLEVYWPRRKRISQILKLLQEENSFTIGLAGRRGLGKTNLLRLSSGLLDKKNKTNVDGDKNKKENIFHLKCITFFLRTPTEFSEVGFLSALLEHFAQRINYIVTPVLGQKPYNVEKELREKRRYLRHIHQIKMFLILTLITTASLSYYNTIRSDWVLQSIGLHSPPLKKNLSLIESPSHSFVVYRDSLVKQIEPKIIEVEDSLSLFYNLLMMRENITALGARSNKTYSSRIDTLYRPLNRRVEQLNRRVEQLDKEAILNFALEYKLADSLLKEIQAHEKYYNSQVHFLESAQQALGIAPQPQKAILNWQVGFFYFWLIFFIAFFILVWMQTRKKDLTPFRLNYISKRQLKNLNDRAIKLIERLQYQMTLGEGRETGFAAQLPEKFLGISFKRSHSTTRAMRPFTIISLTEEYRRFMEDVKICLNDVLRVEAESSKESSKVKIIIAIDELDKVLDITQLHEKLKSIKSIFEIPDVYYILSISEDALETYRLRHLNTKNEIDSAFTHIFNIPPMDAATSLTFFAETTKKLNKTLFPATIVFGGGVPRDMHRLLQISTIAPQKKTLKSCLKELWQEDSNAANDFIKQNPHFSDEWKDKWVKVIDKLNCQTDSDVEKTLKSVDDTTLRSFIRENPCSVTDARQHFHHLRSLVRSMAIKNYIYSQTAKLNTPLTVKTWKKNAETYYKNLQKNKEIIAWLEKLEPLRNAIFELSNNPLGVWGKLKKME